MSIDVMGPIEVDHGYMEFRVNWSMADLYALSTEDFSKLRDLCTEFEALAHRSEQIDKEAAV